METDPFWYEYSGWKPLATIEVTDLRFLGGTVTDLLDRGLAAVIGQCSSVEGSRGWSPPRRSWVKIEGWRRARATRIFMVTARAVLTITANLLLVVLLGAMVLDRLLDRPLPVDFLLVAAVTAGLFLVLAGDRIMSGSPVGSPRRPVDAAGSGLDTVVGTIRTREVRVAHLLVAGLCLWGLVLRGYALGAQSFWIDEALTANAAIALLEQGRPVFPSGQTYWGAFPYTLAVAGSMALFGTTAEWAARAPAVVFGTATIILTYWLGTVVGGRRVGLVAAALLTFLIWEIAWSRQARKYPLLQFAYTVAVLGLVLAERSRFRDWRALAAVVAAVGLAMSLSVIAYALVPIVLAFVLVVVVLEGDRSRPVVVGGGVALLVALVGAGVAGAAFVDLLERLTATENDFGGIYRVWLANELPVLLYLGVVGTVLPFIRGRRRAGVLLLLAVAPPVWALSYRADLLASRYLYFAVPILAVWTAMAIDAAGRFAVEGETGEWLGQLPIGRRGIDRSTALTVTVLGLLLVAGTAGGFTLGPRSHYELGLNAPQADFKGAYGYVDDHREPGDVLVAGWSHPAIYYAGGLDYQFTRGLAHTGASDAVVISEASELAEVMARHDRGWVVVDALAYSQQTLETRQLLGNATERRYQGDRIAVYHWDR